MLPAKDRILLFVALFAFVPRESLAISCYRCVSTNSSNPFQCDEFLEDSDLRPIPCDDVHDAMYCIKHVGRFEASAIRCYQCSASKSLQCSDGMIHISDLEPEDCDHVFEARYCIKSVGLDAGIGTKRFCSSLNLGNYCNYVKQRGDKLQYRTCIHTCSEDGCNSTNLMISNFVMVSSLFTILYIVFYR